MSDHADTIRRALLNYREQVLRDDAYQALDALLAENQRLRKALIAMRELAGVSTEGDPWYAEDAGLDADAIFKQARKALARDTE